VKQNLISRRLLVDTIRDHKDGLKDYFQIVINIAESMIRSSLRSVDFLAQAASGILITAFKSGDTWHKQEIIGSLVTHIGSGISNEMDVSLDILQEIAKEDSGEVLKFVVFIKNILDYLDNLSMSQTQILFDIFSILSAAAENTGDKSLATELSIFIRKQLCSSTEKYKRIGVIATLSLVRHLGGVDEMSEENLKQSIELLNMILTYCAQSIYCLSLTFDELSYLQCHLHESLQKWIHEEICRHFVPTFIINDEDYDAIAENVVSISDAVQPCKLMGLGDEVDYLVNIYPLMVGSMDGGDKVVKKWTDIKEVIAFLPSVARLAFEASDDIDVMLESTLILFEDTGKLKIESKDVKMALCSCLFYAQSWIRELLNAFTVQLSDPRRYLNLVGRVEGLIEVEERLMELVEVTGGWLPVGVEIEEGVVQGVMKGNGSAAAEDEEEDDASINLKRKKRKSAESRKGKAKATDPVHFGCIADLWPAFRELEFSVFGLLQLSEVEIEKSSQNAVEYVKKIDYSVVKYLLNELLLKINEKLGVSSTTRKSKMTFMSGTGFYNLKRMSIDDFFQKLVVVLGFLRIKLDDIMGIYEAAHEEDIEIPEREEVYLQECFDLIIQCFQSIFAFNGFKDGANRQSLIRMLTCVASGDAEGSPIESITELVSEAFGFISRLVFIVGRLNVAIDVLKLMEEISALVPDANEELGVRVRDMANEILKGQWTEKNKGEHLLYLLNRRFDISDVEAKLDCIDHYVGTVLPARWTEDEGVHERNKFFVKDTFPTYYKVAFEHINLVAQSIKDMPADQYETIERVVHNFVKIVDIISKFQDKTVLSVALKRGKVFIDTFLKLLPTLRENFKNFMDKTVKIFRSMQKATRMLQTACNETKTSKEIGLMASVPGLKCSLEKFLYEVKTLFVNNEVQQAFTIGNLKHKDLAGNEVSSQMPFDDEMSDVEEEDDEERPLRPLKKKKKRIVAEKENDLGYSNSGRQLSKSQVDTEEEDDAGSQADVDELLDE